MLVKKTGTSFGPPGKADLIYFIDDLNLPEVDQYDTQSAISLLRMVMQYGRWSHRIKLTWKNILNCQYLASMNPTAGKYKSEGAAREWSTVVIVIVIFIS